VHHRPFLWLIALGCGAMSGCGSAVNVTPVEGVVKLNGKPLINVEVRFAPDCDPNAMSLPFSRALTDAEGRYQLECDNKKPGAVTGKHLVMIRRPSQRPAPGEAPPKAVGPPIPPPYQSFASTPLQIEVTIDKRDYDLNLNSAGK
jgi:hypothetical protein